jgi:HJR/Mrr/RecB family endonuclease
MKVCPACGKKYQEAANFCPRASCASSGRPRRLAPAGFHIPEAARRLVMEFPRKLAADDPPERVRALAEGRLSRAEEAALQTYLGRLTARQGARRASHTTIDFLRYFLPESSRHRPEPGETLRDWDRRRVPLELQRLRARAHEAISERLGQLQHEERTSSYGSTGRRRTRAVPKLPSLQFEAYFEARKPRDQPRDRAALESMTPTQLALYLAAVLTDAGVSEVSSGPITGPEGADLLFSWQGKKVVIQTRSRAGASSSRVVQQIRSAQTAYGADAVWLVSTGRFPPAVHALADEPHVVVIDSEELDDLEAVAARQLRLLLRDRSKRR